MATLKRRIAVALGAVGASGALLLASSALMSLPRSAEAQASPFAPRELVVLAHGLGRSSFSMRPLEKALEAEGYDVLNFSYNSYCCSIPELGEKLRAEIAVHMGPQHSKVHFVGHSLGNIVVRWVLSRDSVPPRVGRVVMLAPPNQGAHSANTFTPWVGWLLVPIVELQADSSATVLLLPPVRGAEIGVIAGRSDRTVKIPETHLTEETAHIVVDGGHSFIMRRDDVHRFTIAFLRTGEFMPAHDRLRATFP